MSILGNDFDVLISGIHSIIDIVVGVILSLGGLIGALLSIIGKLVTILYYLFTFLEIIISIVLNPYLLGLFILGFGFYYASFAAHTRKELLMKTGEYYKYVFESIAKIAQFVYTIAVRIITGLIDMI